MQLLDTTYKRKSAVFTMIIMAFILFVIFTFGLKYLDPPDEYGIAVNFGTTNVGSGSNQSNEAMQTPPQEEIVEEEVQEEVQEQIDEPVEEIETVPTETAPAPAKAEDVITQDNAETIKINKQKEAKRKAEEAKRKVEEAKRRQAEKQRLERLKAERIRKEKAAAEAKKRAEQQAKKAKLDAMMGGLNSGKGNGGSGDGDDNKSGDKGSPDGDPNAQGYYGSGSGGSGRNYRLGNRNAVSTPKPVYDCNEQGRVVVSISVNKSGKVIGANPGVKGTTNAAPCLLKRAKEAALRTKFNSDNNAPAKQVGTIIYNFTLSN
ncbi:MAG: energy transducer TonB [Flavobacteriales bacterium]|nr:MAG: energy transducer TonB [Flavobacteriales bacterium]